MNDLIMPNLNERIPLRKYFYGSSAWINLILLIAVIVAFLINSAFGAMAILTAIIIKIVLNVSKSFN